MPDLVISTFALTGDLYRPVPAFEFDYQEVNSPIWWHFSGGGSRAYSLRFGPTIGEATAKNIDAQNADSHFALNRVLYALVLSGHGFFKAKAVSRVFVENVGKDWHSHTQLDFPMGGRIEASAACYDWIGALTRLSPIRRAAADLYACIEHPYEAALFAYRGLEWLVVGEGRSWDDLAADTGLSPARLRDFKKMANVDYGVRHASKSGKKLRADAGSTADFVAIVFDAINASRARLDSRYEPMTSEAIAKAVIAAMPTDPYP